MKLLEVHGLCKEFVASDGNSVPALRMVSFDVDQGEFVTIVGPSGSGKTTLVKMIAGLINPTKGSVRIHGVSALGPPKELSMVFQDYGRSLLPWKTVRTNIELGIHDRGLRPREKRQRVSKYITLVGLTEYEDLFPWQLSGGMQQRVALARALAREPSILIMDEPFGSLDALTRFDLQNQILTLWQELGITIILVTHDIDEAIYLSDRVVVIESESRTVVSDITINIKRPREQLSTRADPHFSELRRILYHAMKCGANGSETRGKE